MKSDLKSPLYISENNILSEEPLSSEEKWNILLLHCLYFIQGIPFGIFGLAIPTLLVEMGAKYSNVGILSLCLYPFCFKLFFAPLEDIYYSETFGKRKTYVVPCHYIISFTIFILSFFINELLEDKDVISLCVLGFFLVWLLAIQDVAVDGWNLTLLKENHLNWGAISQTIGQAIGILFGGSLVIQLSNIMNIANILKLLAFIIFILNLMIHFKVKEKNPRTHDYSNVCSLVKDLKGFYFNLNLRWYIIFVLTSQIGFSTMANSASWKLIQQGFKKETISMISFITLPLNLAMSFIFGKFAKSSQEMKYYWIFYIILFCNNILIFLLVVEYANFSTGLFLSLYVISSIFGEGCLTLIYVCQGGFINRISDEEVGGTYITFLNSMWNLGRFGTNSLVLFLLDYINYSILVVCSWIYICVYFFCFRNSILKLQTIRKDQWKLK